MIRLKSQAEAIAELAKMLHVQRETIAALLTTAIHPLPLPPKTRSGEYHVFSREYLRRLQRWLVEERKNPSQPLHESMDFDRIQQELQTAVQNCTTYDFLNIYPPGYFLG